MRSEEAGDRRWPAYELAATLLFSNHRPVLRPHSASVAVAGNPKCPRRGQRAFSRVAVASSSPPTAAPPPPRGTTCIAAGRGDAFDVEPLVGEAEGEKVLGGGEEAGDVEQRVVRDAVAEQRAGQGHRLGRGFLSFV